MGRDGSRLRGVQGTRVRSLIREPGLVGRNSLKNVGTRRNIFGDLALGWRGRVKSIRDRKRRSKRGLRFNGGDRARGIQGGGGRGNKAPGPCASLSCVMKRIQRGTCEYGRAGNSSLRARTAPKAGRGGKARPRTQRAASRLCAQ